MKNRIFLIGGIGAVLALGYLKNESAVGLNAISDNVLLSNCEIVQVAAGTDHNLALDKDGNLWAWGRNDHGQLGDGTTINSNVPKQILLGHKFKQISAGNNISAAVDTQNVLYAWGDSANATGVSCVTPTIVSSDPVYWVNCGEKSTFISSDFSFKSVGYSFVNVDSAWSFNEGQNKWLSIMTKRLPHVYSGEAYYSTYDKNAYSYIDKNERYTDKIYGSIGEELYGDAYVDCSAINYERFYAPCTPTYGRATYVSIESYFFAVKKDGQVDYKKTVGYVGGINDDLPGVFREIDVSELKDIVCCDVRKNYENNSGTAFFLDKDGFRYAVGANGSFNLLGTTQSFGENYSKLPRKIETQSRLKEISAGKNHAIAIDDSGNVLSWGDNSYGQLGINTFENKRTPTKIGFFANTKSFSSVVFSGEINYGNFTQQGASSYAIKTNPRKGTMTLDESGNYSYVPNENAIGEDVAIITINYGSLAVDYQVNICIDRRPVFTGGTSSFNVECGQNFDGFAPAIDADGDDLTYSIFETPKKGKVVLNNDEGSFTYTAGLDMAGGDTFIIAVSDGYCTVQYPVSVHIQNLITYSDNTDIKIDLLSGSVYTGNVGAADIDGDTLAYSVKKNGSKGSATIDSLGNYTYTARGDSYGQDSFVIEVDDGYKPLEVTYNVHLYSVADSGTTLAAKITKGAVYNGAVQTNANGVEPVYSVQIQPKNGSVSIDSKTGEYSYTPNMGSSGDDSFVVLVDYDYGQYTLTIHVYQNEIPNNALIAKEIVVQENVNFSGSAQCTDTDGDLLRYAVKTQPLKGSISLNPTTGEYTYYPNENVAGDDSFEINVDDGTDTITNFISVHIESEISVNSNIQKSISQNASLSGNVGASDKDGDALTFSILKNAEHGIASVDSLSGDYVYVPNNNYFGMTTSR